MPRLAEQLRHLFATIPRSGGRDLWTNEEAAAAMTAAGVPISAAYLSQLRTGRRDNPSAVHLAAIGRLFDVPMEYFFDPDVAARIDADLRLLAAVRQAGVRSIALRAQGVSEASLSQVAEMLEHIRRLEQIPDYPATEDESRGT